MKNIKIVIPARYKSSRLPGKPLIKILGKEMIVRVSEICAKIFGKKEVVIATDDKRIKKICNDYKFNSIFTPKNCKTGTDRVFFAAKKFKQSDFFINVQGDEPLISPSDIKKVINAKKKYKNHVICGFTQINYKLAKEINVPKVVINKNSNLIYMSRSLIPACKKESLKRKLPYLKQVCIYAYNFKELKKFNKFNGKSINENLEDIEILRFLDINIPIKMIKVSGGSVSVDVKSDIKKVTNILRNNG